MVKSVAIAASLVGRVLPMQITGSDGGPVMVITGVIRADDIEQIEHSPVLPTIDGKPELLPPTSIEASINATATEAKPEPATPYADIDDPTTNPALNSRRWSGRHKSRSGAD